MNDGIFLRELSCNELNKIVEVFGCMNRFSLISVETLVFLQYKLG